MFWFDGESGTRYIITVTPESISDTRIYVYDPGNEQLGKDEDGGAATAVLDPAPKSGRYHISVRGEMLNDAGDGPTGTYTLRVGVVNPPPPGSPQTPDGTLLWSGKASDIAISGNFGVNRDPDIRVTWNPADPPARVWPYLGFSISDSRSVDGVGSLTVAVPRIAWVAFDWTEVMVVDSNGKEIYLDQDQTDSISDFHSSVGRLIGAIPGVGGVISVIQGIGEVFGEDPSPKSPMFADPKSPNCYTSVSIPWAVDPTLQGGPFHRVTVRVPFVNLESSDTVGLYSGFSVGASTLASAVGGGADAAGAIEIEDLFDSGGSTACPGPSDFVWVPIDVYTDDYTYQFIDSGLSDHLGSGWLRLSRTSAARRHRYSCRWYRLSARHDYA